MYFHYQYTGALGVIRGSKLAPKMSKFIRNICKCVNAARNDSYKGCPFEFSYCTLYSPLC